MEKDSTSKIGFDPEAAARFGDLAQEILNSVRSFGTVEVRTARGPEIHSVMTISQDQIIGEIRVQESAVNALGEEGGCYWMSGGHRVGWEGRDFTAIKELVNRLESSGGLKGKVSHSFLLDETFKWLRETLEGKRSNSFCDYIAERCSAEIREYEIWIPVFRTFSTRDFQIGNVEFKTVSKAMLDEYWSRIPEDEAQKPEIALGISRKRAKIQGGIAACIHVRAELGKATLIAQSGADESIALLRFLSPMNWTCKRVSHCLPVGRENTRGDTSLLVESGQIKKQIEATIEDGPSGWNIDEARAASPGLVELLHGLAVERKNTKFKEDLYRAFQLHARGNVALEVPNKIVFVVAAIESLLLRNSSEPIQKNLGERMAFISGTNLEERKSVVANVDSFYRLRSGIFHHGKLLGADDITVVDTFFFNVWFTLGRLLVRADEIKTRDDLFKELEERKLS